MTRPDLPDFCLLESAAVAAELDTHTDNGLSQAEASRRLRSTGRNKLRAAPKQSALRRVLKHFQDPLTYLLLAAIGIALLAWVLEGREGWPVDAVVISVVVLLNAVLGFVQESKAEQAVAALARMTAVTSSVIRDRRLQRLPSSELVPGDLLVLREGDSVGADARLIDVATLRVQEASLTGESQAVLKNAAPLAAAAPLGDRLNMVFKGTAIVQGSGCAVVTATGMATEMGAIAQMLEVTQHRPTPLQIEVSRIGRMLAIAVVIIAMVVVAAIFLTSEISNATDVIGVLLLGVALAVAAVPEGLPAILSVVLALGVQRMAKRKAIVKNLSSVETLGSASVICTDKTGTLTRSEMTIQRIVTASGSTHVTGVGYSPKGRVEHEGAELKDGLLRHELIVVLSGGSLASNAQLRQTDSGTWEIQGDPTEAAFLVAERKLGVSKRRQQRFERVGQIPFTSERKMMSTIERDHEHADELVVITKGAPDVLLNCCNRIRIGMGVEPLTGKLRRQILADVDSLSGDALRTLAVAYRPLHAGEAATQTELMEQDLIYAGTVGMMDPPREEAAVAIAQAHLAGIRVIMITGDHPLTAAKIAQDLGMTQAGDVALTGGEMDALKGDAFAQAVRKTSVYARVSPAHKLRIVAALQADGNIVAMTGDGVNDAPALKAADIGIAMGVTGTEVTKEAAKMVLADDNFATIVQAVREGRGIFDNIRKFLRYLLSSNMGEVLTVFLGVVGAGVIGLTQPGTAVVLPLLATQILWLNLITDSWPALALGTDPPSDDVMQRKPRPTNERVIDARMWGDVFEIGMVIAVVTLLTMDLNLPGGLIEGSGDLVTARTAGFTVLVIAHLLNCFNSRSVKQSAFTHLFSNLWLWGAVALSTVLQIGVVHIPVLNVAFGTAPLTLNQWLVCAAMGSVPLWYSELRKLGSRAWQASQTAIDGKTT